MTWWRIPVRTSVNYKGKILTDCDWVSFHMINVEVDESVAGNQECQEFWETRIEEDAGVQTK